MNALTDEALAQVALQDMQAFEALIERYQGKLKHYVARISHFSEMECEEILQDIFIRIWKNLNDFDSDMKFSTWAYRIAHNCTISAWRKAKSRGDTERAELDPELFDQIADEFDFIKDVEAKFTAERVHAVLEKLPEKYRHILVLRFLEDLSYEEISDVLQKPPGTVATLLNRAKSQFKSTYNQLYN